MLRTVVFCLVNAALTMVIGGAIALLMRQDVEAGPAAGADRAAAGLGDAGAGGADVWQWLFDSQYGVINWVLTRLGAEYDGHSWLLNSLSFFLVATVIVVWMSVPFVAFTVYAALTQVSARRSSSPPRSTARAPRQRLRHIVVPTIMPVLLVVAPAPDHLGPARLHPDLRAAEGRRRHPRHQPARHLHLPGAASARATSARGRGRDLHAGADRDPDRAVRAPHAAAGGTDAAPRQPRQPRSSFDGIGLLSSWCSRSRSTGWSRRPSRPAARSARPSRPGTRSAAASTTTAGCSRTASSSAR